VSEAAHARLLAVAVGGNIATTTDTTSPFMAQWTRTGKATWKVSAPPQRDVLPFTDTGAETPRDPGGRRAARSRSPTSVLRLAT
jgi:hypothetical protein